ncbi:pectate lyase [Aeoliella mucimassa]|uniref:Pectic acid lyase n=1 Tax=Aeoliella mucimassa TaxID=2527972 RepID=A0A518ANK2_9BACT|nr:pectate lyase [Aeoliella mucimassa]QDU56303.1 Pectic acid lyase [Aeoliella mucimassa]
MRDKPWLLLVVIYLLPCQSWAVEPVSRDQAVTAMKQAATYYREQVASHGGYVYYYSPDLLQRWGEGPATADQIWVQPPGTPTVGMAYLRAYRATGDRFYLEAATDTAKALVYGQLRSGGWTNCIDFDPHGKRLAEYRNGHGAGKNYSSLDDGQTQSAILFLMHVDEALQFKNEAIHESVQVALTSLLEAQFPCGAFPQVWQAPVSEQPVKRANYPDYDWRTEGRIKEYWNYYTLNDNVCGYVAEVLIAAHRIYGDAKYLEALKQLGDFLILAQMPASQQGWAQQYNYQMQPIWARAFEPPGVSGDESQETISTLMVIAEATGETKYLQPLPPALAYLERSLLPNGQLARYYELQTNRPLYMTRRGKSYQLTYDDTKLPSHYGWKTESRLPELKAEFQRVLNGTARRVSAVDAEKAGSVVEQLDEKGRWLTTFDGEPLVGQPKFASGEKYLSSQVFSQNLELLSRYVEQLAN